MKQKILLPLLLLLTLTTFSCSKLSWNKPWVPIKSDLSVLYILPSDTNIYTKLDQLINNLPYWASPGPDYSDAKFILHTVNDNSKEITVISALQRYEDGINLSANEYKVKVEYSSPSTVTLTAFEDKSY